MALLMAGVMHLLVFAGWSTLGFQWNAAPVVSRHATPMLVLSTEPPMLPTAPVVDSHEEFRAVLPSDVSSKPVPIQAAKSVPSTRVRHTPASPPPSLPRQPVSPKPISVAPSSSPGMATLPNPSASPASVSATYVPPRHEAAYLHNPAPVYPVWSRRRQEAGTVQLQVRVSHTGAPTQVTILNSSGYSRLDQAAVNTVQQWRFEPARRGETPVDATVTVPVTFQLNR